MSGLVRLCSEGAGWARYMQCVACPRPPSRTRPSTQKLDILIGISSTVHDTSVPYIVSYRARRIKDSYLDEARVRVAGALCLGLMPVWTVSLSVSNYAPAPYFPYESVMC